MILNTGQRTDIPAYFSQWFRNRVREGCSCLLGGDIGAYNTCGHGCLYCYANYDRRTVEENLRLHDPASPLLIGYPKEGEEIREAQQVSWRTGQYVLKFT